MNIDMQVIEDLGGYLKAKEISKMSSHALVPTGKDGKTVHVTFLKKALLEYRRIHNIYEVGDSLVIRDLSDPCNRVFKVDRIGACGGIYDEQWRKLRIKYFRHATDDEITADIRLPIEL